MRIVLMGTPDFSVRCFEGLRRAGHEIGAVVTQPDRPKGRGLELTPPPVKVWARQIGLEVLQSEDVNAEGVAGTLARIEADLLVVVAFGQILKQPFLECAQHGAVNVHASLLPRYRGAAPIQRAIMAGERETGVTTILMDEGMDTGPILLQRSTVLGPEETAGELHDRLARLGAEVLSDTVELLAGGALLPVSQEHDEATYAPAIRKGEAAIEWGLPAESIYNLVRAMNPWPVAFTEHRGGTVKVWTAVPGDRSPQSAPAGEVVALDEQRGPSVACGEGCLSLTEVQPAGGRRISGADFCRGYGVEVGTRLGAQGSGDR